MTRRRAATGSSMSGTLSFLLALIAVTPAASYGQDVGTELPKWMSGCWSRESRGTIYEEQWMEARGGTMMGMARTVRDGVTVSFEHLRIDGSGEDLVYIALPSGQALTEFRGVVSTDSLVVFENPEHDFPQRVLYRRITGDSIVARIEGDMDGDFRAVDFPLARAACAGSGRE